MSHDPGLLPEPLGDAGPDGDWITSIYPRTDGGWLVKMKVDGKTTNYGVWPTRAEAIGVRNEVRERRGEVTARKRKPDAPNPLAAVTPVLPPETAVVPDPPPPVAPEARDMRNIKQVKNRYYVTLSICGSRPENLGVFDTYEEAVAIRNLNWVRRDKLRVQKRAEKDEAREEAREEARKNKKQKQPQVVWGTIGPEPALSWGESGLSI